MSMWQQLVLVGILTMVIHMIDTFSYAVRVAGVRVGRLALALSLFNILVLVSRTSNMVQAPLVAKFVDYGRQTGELAWVEEVFRWVIGFASIGTLFGILLLPSFVAIFVKAIPKLEMAGSVPQLLTRTLSIHEMRRVGRTMRRPRLSMLHRFRIADVPKRLIILQIAITGIYTVGVLSATYAALLAPDHAIQAANSSGLINGIATIMLTLFVDPKVALMTDQALQRKKPPSTVTTVAGVLVFSKLAGTLLAQLLFFPAAQLIAWFASI